MKLPSLFCILKTVDIKARDEKHVKTCTPSMRLYHVWDMKMSSHWTMTIYSFGPVQRF
jgi:hypothetical protein